MPVLFLAAVEWRPVASPLQIAVAALVVGGLAVFAYWRSPTSRLTAAGLLAMRLATIAVLAILLLGPSRTPPSAEQATRPRLAVLLDTSESMLTSDCLGESRMAFAQRHWLTPERLQRLQAEYQLELFAFDEQLRPMAAEQAHLPENKLALGAATELAESATQAAARFSSGDAGAAMLVISDGRDSQDSPLSVPAARAAANRTPIYTVALGGGGGRPDMALVATPLQEFLLPGEPGAILVRVYQSGLGQAETVLSMTQGGRKVETKIAFHGNSMVESRFPIEHDQEGTYEYALELSPVSGEAETDNNRQTVFCQVQRRRIRALVLEGQPYWDSKFLVQALRKDERLELTQITQLSESKSETIVTRNEGTAPQLPASEEQWAAFDVVVLGQAMENVFHEQTGAQLVQFVSGGGKVIFARGRCYDPQTPGGRAIARQIAPIEPVSFESGRLADLKLSLAPAGRSNPWLSQQQAGAGAQLAFSRLGGFESASVVSREKTAAVVLARAAPGQGGGGQPGIVSMNYGRGAVLAVLGDGSWRWSLLTPENRDLIGFYDSFWCNLVRWMVMGGDFQPGEQVALNLSRSSARLGDAVTIDVAYRHSPQSAAPPSLAVVDSRGHSVGVALRKLPGREPRYRAEFSPQAVGVHRVELTSPGLDPARQEKKFNVYQINFERLNAAANPEAMRTLAEESGGEVLDPQEPERLFTLLARRKAAAIVPPSTEYLWDRWPIMVLLLCWCGAEWLLRRRADLL